MVMADVTSTQEFLLKYPPKQNYAFISQWNLQYQLEIKMCRYESWEIVQTGDNITAYQLYTKVSSFVLKIPTENVNLFFLTMVGGAETRRKRVRKALLAK